MSWRWRISACFCAVAVGAGCASSSDAGGAGPDVAVETNEIELVHRTQSRVSSFLVAPICLTQAGRVKIVSVDAISSDGGAHVSAFSVFPAAQLPDPAPGELDVRISESEIYRGSQVVDRACRGPADDSLMLAVEVTRPSSAQAAGTRGLRLRYGGGAGQVSVPYDLTLCSSPQTCQ